MDATSTPRRLPLPPRRREGLAAGAAAEGALLLGGLTAGQARATTGPATHAETATATTTAAPDPYERLRDV
jgi:hypothetical protein